MSAIFSMEVAHQKLKSQKIQNTDISDDCHEESDIEVLLEYNLIQDEHKSCESPEIVSESELEPIAPETSTNPMAPPKQLRTRKSTKDWQDTVGQRKSTRVSPKPQRFDESFQLELDKPTEEQALAGKDQEKWIEAMEKEREQVRKYGVYEKLKKLPPGEGVIDTKWVLAIKRNNRIIDKYQARKVARGFTQENQKHYVQMNV
jgi:hypothetical protein